MKFNITLAPPRILRRDGNQIPALHIRMHAQIIRHINSEEMPKEELLEKVVLVQIDIDKLDVLVLRDVFAAEEPFERLNLPLCVVVRVGVEERDDGLLLRRVGVRRDLGV